MKPDFDRKSDDGINMIHIDDDCGLSVTSNISINTDDIARHFNINERNVTPIHYHGDGDGDGDGCDDIDERYGMNKHHYRMRYGDGDISLNIEDDDIDEKYGMNKHHFHRNIHRHNRFHKYNPEAIHMPPLENKLDHSKTVWLSNRPVNKFNVVREFNPMNPMNNNVATFHNSTPVPVFIPKGEDDIDYAFVKYTKYELEGYPSWCDEIYGSYRTLEILNKYQPE